MHTSLDWSTATTLSISNRPRLLAPSSLASVLTERLAPTRIASGYIAEDAPDRHAQGYFVYDSQQSPVPKPYRIFASGKEPIRAPYLVRAMPTSSLAIKFEFLMQAVTCLRARCCPVPRFFSNTPYSVPAEVWETTAAPGTCKSTSSRSVYDSVRDRRDVRSAKRSRASARRINTILQTCFFAISGVLPRDRSNLRNQALDRKGPMAARAVGAGRSRGISQRSTRALARIYTKWRGPKSGRRYQRRSRCRR